MRLIALVCLLLAGCGVAHGSTIVKARKVRKPAVVKVVKTAAGGIAPDSAKTESAPPAVAPKDDEPLTIAETKSTIQDALDAAAAAHQKRLENKVIEAISGTVGDDPAPPNPSPPPEPPTPGQVEPQLILPAQVEGDVGSFIKIKAQTNAKEVRWVPLDKGLAVFPGEMLRDSTTTVVMSSAAGQYRMLAYTALNDIPSDPVTCMVVVHGPQPPPVPPTPPVPPQPKPDPAPAPPPQPVNPTAAKLFIITIDDVSKRDPRVAAVLSDMAMWNEFKAAGHEFVKMNSTESGASLFKKMIDSNGGLPVVILEDATTYNPNLPPGNQILKWLNQGINPTNGKPNTAFPATSDGMKALIARYSK